MLYFPSLINILIETYPIHAGPIHTAEKDHHPLLGEKGELENNDIDQERPRAVEAADPEVMCGMLMV